MPVIGCSLDDFDAERFRSFTRKALDEFSTRPVTEADWSAFAEILDYVPLAARAEGVKAAVARRIRDRG